MAPLCLLVVEISMLPVVSPFWCMELAVGGVGGVYSLVGCCQLHERDVVAAGAPRPFPALLHGGGLALTPRARLHLSQWQRLEGLRENTEALLSPPEERYTRRRCGREWRARRCTVGAAAAARACLRRRCTHSHRGSEHRRFTRTWLIHITRAQTL